MTEFYVKVTPDQREHHIDTSGTYPHISLTRPAENHQANTELVSLLETVLNADVHIIAGHRSRRKKIGCDLPKDEIMQKLSDQNTLP